MRTIVVVGGGVAGLSVARALAERPGVEVACLEGGEVPGGNVRTDRDAGFTCEWGPNGFLDNSPPTLELVRRLGIEDRLLPSDGSAAKRFIVRDGKLRALPSGPVGFLVSDVLSWRGKARVLTEPLRAGKRDLADESVLAFATRRIGAEAASVLVDAMVTGIYAGDPAALSLGATFPKMQRMEIEHGTLTRAMLAKRKSGTGGGPAGPGGRLTSFRNGFRELPEALASALGASFRPRSKVVRVDPMGVRGFRVHLESGGPVDAQAVVLACPSWAAAPMVERADAALAGHLAAIPSASLAVVHLGYRASDLPSPLDGFGYLVPHGERRRLLGCLWASSIFPGRAPEGHALLTCMIGGARDAAAMELDDGALVSVIRRELGEIQGIAGEPAFVKIFRHRRGIPQYVLGHPARLEAIERGLSRFPGLLVCGNSYRGISVNACIAESASIADRALAAAAR